MSFSVVHLLVTWKLRDRIVAGFPDYTIFYTAGTLVRRGMASRLYDADLQYQVQKEFAYAARHGRGLLPYNHPPHEALLFVPLSYLPYMSGYAIWAAVNLVLFFLALSWARPHVRNLRSVHWTLWAILPIGFFPVFSTLFEGQDSILLLVAYTMALVNLKRGRPWLAGICLALALFKFQLVIPFIGIAVITRCWKLVSGFAVAAFVLALVNVALVGWRTALYYPSFVRYLEHTTAGGAIIPMSMPNLHGLLDATIGRISTQASVIITVVLSLFLLLIVVRALRRFEFALQKNDLCFALALVVTVLVSYHVFWYDWTVLLLAALLTLNYLAAAAKTRTMTPASRVLLVTSCTLFVSPIYLAPLARFGHTYGLAVLLLTWGWALLREIQTAVRLQPGGLGQEELQAALVQT